MFRHFNPPSPCGEGPAGCPGEHDLGHISIHPPRVGRDPWLVQVQRRARYFNPPSPCGEGPFQRLACADLKLISIHPPRVGRDYKKREKSGEKRRFQSTLPVWGGTPGSGGSGTGGSEFQSTLPVWGGTSSTNRECGSFRISIHPPRVGRDVNGCTSAPFAIDFNPPSPCGEGQVQQSPMP